jgi:hypothetical protein
MTAEEMLVEFRQLNRVEKIRILQLFVNDLAVDEGAIFPPDVVYEVWSPFDSAEAAFALQKVIEKGNDDA